jgi:hypothetical protein
MAYTAALFVEDYRPDLADGHVRAALGKLRVPESLFPPYKPHALLSFLPCSLPHSLFAEPPSTRMSFSLAPTLSFQGAFPGVTDEAFSESVLKVVLRSDVF